MKTIKVNQTTSSRRYTASVYAMLAATAMLAARSAAAQQVHALRVARLPRVYNALISSEQDLLPSQAHPIVPPVVVPVYYGWPFVAPNVRPVIASPFQSTVEVVDPLTGALNVMAAGDGGGVSSDGVGGASGGIGDGAQPRGQQRPAVKNNRPVDSAVPDVPPPPLPVSAGRADKKKPEEYPPAPGGFAI